MVKLSITRRLIVSVLLTQLVLTIAVVTLASFLTWRQLRKSFDAALQGRAMSVAALVRFSEDARPRLMFDASQVPPPLDGEHPDLFEIVGAGGERIAASPNLPADFPGTAPSERSYWNLRHGDDPYRVIRLNNTPVLDREGPDTTTTATITVTYAASTEDMLERVWTIALLTCFGSLALLAISTAVTVWAVRRGLSPLAALTASAGRVSAETWKLDASQQARSTEELLPLTEAMDGMLAGLQQAFTSQREFVANAAHELKTPIAVLKSTLQLLIQRPRTADEYRAQVEIALEDVARLETLTHSMLRLARAEEVQTSNRRHDLPLVDVAMTCEESAGRLRAVADNRSVRIEVKSQGSPRLHADPEDLEMIWNNLLENAVRYSPTDSAVIACISIDGQYAQVEIRDCGSGIPTSDLQNIFNRFHRADASRSRETGGYGLGLAIVKAMVDAYGGTISAESGDGNGTRMCVRLPIQS
ncbi:MAG TPA: ATP-binding protein [Clostridia bacterium]|nr:ATP-binding protein [Clostridia bacterium]